MARITIDRDACKGCGLCAINCPEKLIVIEEVLNVRGVHPAKFIGQDDPDKCKGCKMCAIMCPEVCIEVFK